MGRVLKAAAIAGMGALAAGFYGSFVERNAFVLRRETVPILPPGSPDVRVLHISDMHMMPGQARKQRWINSLAMFEPDLVINTGDNIADRAAIVPVMEALDPLLDKPGVFVFGSNDYFSPSFKNPFGYFSDSTATSGERVADMPVESLRSGFTNRGWVDLNNAKGDLKVRGLRFSFVGVNDPHLNYDDLDAVAGPAKKRQALTIGVTHAPYLRVLDQWNREGYRLLIAGHTHGGQVAVPGYGALVTNCDLDTERAKGLHQHQVNGNQPSWLHVSAGCGTSPYAPIRFACRPEATLLTLTGLDSGLG